MTATASPRTLRKGGSQRAALREAARIELGMRAFLTQGGFKAFTTTFEDLHGLAQLPGLAVQRLMADGYGFGAEGDWKTCRAGARHEGHGRRPAGRHLLHGRLHLSPRPGAGMKVLGAHMLEVCSSIADGKPSLEIHPLGIGGKADPARLVFNVRNGPAINASVIDMGNRFRMIVNEVDVVPPDAPLPKLPVARVVWVPNPISRWLPRPGFYAGGAHHTGFSQVVTAEHIEDFAEMAGMEFVLHRRGHADQRVQERTALERDVLPSRQRAVTTAKVGEETHPRLLSASLRNDAHDRNQPGSPPAALSGLGGLPQRA